MDRRRFLAAATATALSLRSAAAQRALAELTLGPHSNGPTVPTDFVGLSYEMRQLAVPGFFSAGSKQVVDLVRSIAPRGILRLGGNTSDGGYWLASPGAPMPAERPAHPFGSYAHPVTPFAISPAMLHDLRGFLDATGWDCIYGVNLGTNNPQLAADEAAAVVEMLGTRLVCLQIGNEADRYGINFRRDPKTWTPETFMDEWLTFAHAIVARVPSIPLGVPDLAAKPEWIADAADRVAKDPIRRSVRTLTYHYYVDGPPGSPQATIDRILHADKPALYDEVHVMQKAAAQLGITWRMTEGNTIWNGGGPGVSDRYASALWAADYFLLLASFGCAGINLHGGEPLTAATGPADDDAHPYYTPIANIHGKHRLQPVAYGMRFAAAFAGASFVTLKFDSGVVNATAYAATKGSETLLALINKDATQPLRVDLNREHTRASGQLPVEPHWQSILTLTGSALDARDATLQQTSSEDLTVAIPPATAVLFHRHMR